MDLALKAVKDNSDFNETAKKFWRIAKSHNDFQTLKDMGKKGENLYKLFDKRFQR